MTEKKAPGTSGSDRPREEVTGELKEKRDAFLHTFFRRGAELTEELVGENRRLREQLGELEKDNAALKTHLASDAAIRDLLKKIEELEREKARLLSTVHAQAEITNRFAEIESELESFANLYVASFQIHSSLRVRTAVRHIRELLVQLVGARRLAIYFVDEGDKHLSPIAADGVDVATVPVIDLREAAAPASAEAIVERTYLTGVPHLADTDPIASPAACIPLQLENRTVGVIVVYSLLEHKKRFVAVDRELFKLLGAHAGGTIVSAYLWGQAGGRSPSAAALRELCA
ncbi:MAG TPA: GAF domain-containing protein [Polyangiaceae bacterium]|nr:GAF domain-containing protein [Polyangiaceae bacterium]